MKVLITGVAGFIGSNLAEYLTKKGFKIIGIDNLHTGKKDNVQNLIKTRKLKFYNLSSGEIGKIDEKVKCVFHLGIPSSSPMYKKDKKLIVKSIDEAIKIFEYCLKNDIPLIIAGTSSVYNGNELPYSEEMEIKPFDFYTEVRYSIERLAKVYSSLYGLRVIVLRLFSVYGPKEQFKKCYANMITQFIWHGLKNKRPIIYGNGTQTRDFIHVSDVCEMFYLSYKLIKDVENGFFEIFNVGSGIETSFNQIWEIICDMLGKNIKPKYVENPIKNYVYRTRADMTKVLEWFGFYPSIELENGIEMQIKYYEKIIDLIDYP